MKEVSPDSAGRYRSTANRIAGARVMTSMPSIIPAEVASLAEHVAGKLQDSSPLSLRDTLELATQAHHELTRIHPFDDGNGRVARLYLNYICRFNGLPYVSLPKVGMEQPMNEALKSADQGDMRPAVALYANLLEDSFDRVLAHIG